ncbi:hypothetical protein BEP19_16850 [Ammoniphilus oxalaticus]|uniref:Uncharacterized protein n=1 Tax=Ammoniphilus oxalaticus TaxID=66863 RepID=A0A419SQ83_9BACL|nr:hypothetical protein [Ammoniphilus oxalaticus]RKD26505.1 hypothetical protein BEP19_16850 [Ammoniphilus oxalaticus]
MKLTKEEFSLQYITDTVTEQVTRSVQASLNQTISKEINRIRLGANNIDRNTQILIEMVQGHIQMQNLEYVITTDMVKPPFLKDIEGIVQERIEKQKQRKDSRER